MRRSAIKSLTPRSTLVLALETARKVALSSPASQGWLTLESSYLTNVLPSLLKTFQPVAIGGQHVEFDRFSPFAILLVYRAAMLETKTLAVTNDVTEALSRLRIFRKFLEVVAQRWLSGGWLTGPFCLFLC